MEIGTGGPKAEEVINGVMLLAKAINNILS
jgi:hypothetical protein